MPDGFYDHKSEDYWSRRGQSAVEPCRQCGRTSDVRFTQDPFVAAGVVPDQGSSWGWWCPTCLRRRRDDLEG